MTSVAQLDSYFLSLVNDLMLIERQPLQRLTQARDNLGVLRGAYQDANGKLKGLQRALDALSITKTPTAFTPGRQAAVANAPSGFTVVTASASSSAIPGTYEVEVSELAQAQRVQSRVFGSVDTALGLGGTFWLGGTGTAAANAAANGTLAAAGTAAVATGQRELGAGTYTLETRTYEGVAQFRLKDADGNTVSIDNGATTNGSMTATWQNLTAGVFDTGRGLTLNLTGNATEAASTLTYTARGVGLAVEAADTLQSLANKINTASQPEGRDVAASVVGNQLVLTAVTPGTNHTMVYADQVSLGGLPSGALNLAALQPAKDATFTVNDIPFTRSGNSGLRNVVSGLTLNLAADAQGRSATVTVNNDISATRGAIETFVKEFNGVQAYLRDRTAVSSITSGDTRTYTRGSLSNDTVFGELRGQLFSAFTASAPNSGIFQSLRAIGLTLDDNLQASISDSTKLEAALSQNLEGVKALFDKLATTYSPVLSRFTASGTGYIDAAVSSFERELTATNTEISQFNTRLAERQEFLQQQFAEVQVQLMQATYLQQQLSAYGNYGRLA